MGWMQFVYLALLIFVGIQVRNILLNRKKAETNPRSFKVRNRLFMVVSATILLLLGVMQLMATPKGAATSLIFTNVVVILVALGLLFIAQDRTVLSDEGIYSGGRFTPWDEVKQWSFVNQDKVLTLSLVPRSRAKSHIIMVKPEDKPEIGLIIQSYKAKKKNRVKKKK